MMKIITFYHQGEYRKGMAITISGALFIAFFVWLLGVFFGYAWAWMALRGLVIDYLMETSGGGGEVCVIISGIMSYIAS
jgi:hypothetical protein